MMKASLALAVVAAAFVAVVGPAAAQVTDIDILNFALNLEYLEGEFYTYATTGHGLPAELRGGGPASEGGMMTPFNTGVVKRIANEIAHDEQNHIRFLRTALGSAAVPIPKLNIGTAFSAAADASLNTTLSPPFTPYLSQPMDLVFLIGSFVFEDVGVTAYKGAAPLISDKTYLSAAAGILAVEAYHAATARTLLYRAADVKIEPYGATVETITSKVSALRAKVGGGSDAGLVSSSGGAVIVPTDANSIAYSRTPSEVLRIVYLGGTSSGGFFPNGLNGNIKTAM